MTRIVQKTIQNPAYKSFRLFFIMNGVIHNRIQVLVVLAILSAGLLYGGFLSRRVFPPISTPTSNMQSCELQSDYETTDTIHFVWSPLKSFGQSTMEASDSGLNERYRLAGTFFSGDHRTDHVIRAAIIDHLQTGEQLVLQEQMFLNEYQVVSVERDRVKLKKGNEEHVLLIAFHDRAEKGIPLSSSDRSETEQEKDDSVMAKQIGENRWILNRKMLMNYYSELLDDPERLASIYISLKPDYNPDKKITGYELDMVGEKTFFKEMGLEQGDHIRKVNSMNMTSQTRGEYFLKEFVNNRLSAIVLDVERDNVPKKMIYLVR